MFKLDKSCGHWRKENMFPVSNNLNVFEILSVLWQNQNFASRKNYICTNAISFCIYSKKIKKLINKKTEEYSKITKFSLEKIAHLIPAFAHAEDEDEENWDQTANNDAKYEEIGTFANTKNPVTSLLKK